MKAPRFWSGQLDPKSREAAPLTRALLTPLAVMYAHITARKIRNTKPYKSDAIVICVGNLTVGGVGKSPIVSAIRSRLRTTSALRVATLSRGYGGQLKGPLRVDPEGHTAEEVGDEPLMLAMHGESWIGADRAAAAKAMCEDGVDVIVMDDGHQNPSLEKDLNIVVIDSFDPFGNGFVIPKGPLREPIHAGLARADAVVSMGTELPPNILTETGLPILRAEIKATGKCPTGPLVAFAGIGRPEKLFDTLKALGADLRDSVPFPDHHVYSSGDLRYLERLANDHEAQLITTEKDYTRLAPEDRQHILTLPVEAHFEDTEALDKLLADV